MKKIILFAAVVLMAGFSTTAMAADVTSKSLTVDAGAQLIVPMTLVQGTPLHFGTINLLAGAAGTVILNTAGVRSFTGVAESLVIPHATNATFTVGGTKNETYALTLPETITVTESGVGATTMTISALTVKFGTAAEKTAVAATSVLSDTGADSFIVGGTLTVTVAQAGGIYAGTFPVTVDYN